MSRCTPVLITTAGSGTGFHAVMTARSFEELRVIAGDANPRHLVAASLEADQFVQVPYASESSYRETVLQLVRAHGVRYWLPILDEEIVHAAAMREKLMSIGCRVHAPACAGAEICLDKLRMAAWLKEHGIGTPKTCELAQAQWWPDGVFIKPRMGRGSNGARRVLDPEEFRRLQSERGGLICQEMCRGPEVTVDTFASADGGAVRSVCRERLETKAGVCTKARVFADMELAAVASRLSAGLGLRGVFCFQVMRSPHDDAWLVTDINPRPGAGTAISARLGFDTVRALFAELGGQDFGRHLQLPERPRYVVRTYCEHVTG